MSITIKLDELVNANAALMEMGELTSLDARTAFAIGVVIRKTRDELRAFNDQRRKILLTMFPAPAKDSKDAPKLKPHPQVPGEYWLDPSVITMEESASLDAQMQALGQAEVTIEASKLKLTAFNDKVPLKPSWLASLYWLIDA